LISLKSEEVLKSVIPIIPEALAKDLAKAIKDNNQEEVDRLTGQIKPIVDAYNAKMTNFNMNEGEQIQWAHTVTRGMLRKEPVQKWIITNMRASILDLVTKDNPKQKMSSVGLALADVVVMNQRRQSSGDRIGSFVYVRGAGAGTSTYSSTSRSYGDLVFYLAGREVLRFPGISDPQGVKRMIATLKKQTSSL